MNLAFSDSEVEIIKNLNKGLCLYPISMVPCKRHEAKSCRDVATIMTCTCLSRASLLHSLPCRPWIWLRLSNYHTCQRHKNISPFPDRLRGSRNLLADDREGSSVVKWPESEAVRWYLSVTKFRIAYKFTTALVYTYVLMAWWLGARSCECTDNFHVSLKLVTEFPTHSV